MKIRTIDILIKVSIFIIVLFAISCQGDKFDQKSFNLMAQEVKAEFNKFAIPCGSNDKVKIDNQTASTINGMNNQLIELEKFKKHVLHIEDVKVDFIINKANENGFQFKYSTDLIDYQLDRKPIVTRDEGTIWMYCDKYKKYNTPRAKEPASPTGVMITVE